MSSGVEVLEGGKEPHDFSVRITYTREAPDFTEDEEDQPVSEVYTTCDLNDCVTDFMNLIFMSGNTSTSS